MPFYQQAHLRYYSFASLQDHPITQAIFSRQGGASPAPWASLNVGGTVGDLADRVKENRRLIYKSLGRSVDSAFEVWQVHGSTVAVADEPRANFNDLPQADAVLTANPRVTLFMRFADCVPILLSDPVRKAIGIVHAGWQGTVRRTALSAVHAMQGHFGCRPEDIHAGIGPSIGPDHYEIGADVAAQVQQAFGTAADVVLSEKVGRTFFDLWEANRLLLSSGGVRHIEVSGLCTGCHLEDWYSHRLENGKTGRFGALLALNA